VLLNGFGLMSQVARLKWQYFFRMNDLKSEVVNSVDSEFIAFLLLFPIASFLRIFLFYVIVRERTN